MMREGMSVVGVTIATTGKQRVVSGPNPHFLVATLRRSLSRISDQTGSRKLSPQHATIVPLEQCRLCIGRFWASHPV